MERIKSITEIANESGVGYKELHAYLIDRELEDINGAQINKGRQLFAARLPKAKRVPAQLSCFNLYTLRQARKILGINNYQLKVLSTQAHIPKHLIGLNIRYLTSDELIELADALDLKININKTGEMPTKLLTTLEVGKILECDGNFVLRMIYDLYITRPTKVSRAFIFTEKDVTIIAEIIESVNSLRLSKSRRANRFKNRTLALVNKKNGEIVFNSMPNTIEIDKSTKSKITKLISETGLSEKRICKLAINNYLQMFIDLFC